MSCTINQGYKPKRCKIPGGVKEILLANYDNVVLPVTITAGVVTAITMTLTNKFFKYSQKAEIATWGQVITGDAKQGTYAVEQTLNLQMNGLDALEQVELEKLVQGTLIAIVKNSDGQYWMLGLDNGLDVVTDTLESGTAFGDFQGNKLAFSARESVRAVKVNDAIIAALL